MTRNATILLVEDDFSLLEGMKDLLHVLDFGYRIHVETAVNGREGLAKIKKSRPNLIVSDIMMPVMDGMEFLQEVRKNPDWFSIPFIFLTAKGEEHEIHKGRLSGADLYITKPFESNKLVDLIKTQLDRSFKLESSRKQSLESMKKGILQVLNHEMRTPLTYVTAYYEMLAESMASHPESTNMQEYLRGILAGCARLNRLVEDFILVIELRTGETQKEIEADIGRIDDINALVSAIIRDYENVTQIEKIPVEFVAQENLPAIYGSPKGIRQILMRVLDNAVKFTYGRLRQNGRIIVKTHTENDELVIDFIDQGFGIPKSEQERIFDLFYQYNRSTHEQQGIGVGLTIAKGLLDFHGGHIEIESEENVGSTFSIHFPLTPPQKRPLPTTQPQKTKQEATILVVEDDEHLLIGLRELLQLFQTPYKLRVLTATNGLEGLDVVRSHTIHLIISDITMSPMNGLEFLDEIRQMPAYEHIPFIFLTARSEPQDIHRGWAKGVQMYITKPYDSNQLIEYVVALLNRYFKSEKIIAQGFEELKRSILELMTPTFRVPLNSVAKYSSRLSNSMSVDGLADAKDDAQLKEALQGIKEGGAQLTALVEDFIALAELRTGEAETAYKTCAQPIPDARWVFLEALQKAQNWAENAGVALTIQQPETLPMLFGDSNLIANALERVIRHGLKLCQQHKQDTLQIMLDEVEDVFKATVALPTAVSQTDYQQMQKHLIDPIDKTDNPFTQELPSLQIVRGYIQLHNGRIQLTNTPNLTITLILPIYKGK